MAQHRMTVRILDQRKVPLKPARPCCSPRHCSRATIWIGSCRKRASWACGRFCRWSHTWRRKTASRTNRHAGIPLAADRDRGGSTVRTMAATACVGATGFAPFLFNQDSDVRTHPGRTPRGSGIVPCTASWSPDRKLALVIGPEGGWAEEELTLALTHGCHAVSLGTHILRADTAAVTALSIVQSRLGRLG